MVLNSWTFIGMKLNLDTDYSVFTILNSKRITGLNVIGSYGKESICNTGDSGSILGLGRSPGEGSGNPLQYSCLRIPWTEEPGRM